MFYDSSVAQAIFDLKVCISKIFQKSKWMHKLFSFVNGAFSKRNDLICTNIINPKKNRFDMIWSFSKKDHISRGEGKNVITKATFASASSLLDFDRWCKGPFHFKVSAKTQVRRAAHQDLSNCSDEVQSSLAISSDLLSYKIPSSSLCFPVSKLGSDWSVCVTHVHLRVIYYEYSMQFNHDYMHKDIYIYVWFWSW